MIQSSDEGCEPRPRGGVGEVSRGSVRAAKVRGGRDCRLEIVCWQAEEIASCREEVAGEHIMAGERQGRRVSDKECLAEAGNKAATAPRWGRGAAPRSMNRGQTGV